MAIPLTQYENHFGGWINGHGAVVAFALFMAVLLSLGAPMQARAGTPRIGFARAVDCAGLLHGSAGAQGTEHHPGYAHFESTAIALGGKARLKRSQVKRAILGSAGRARRFSLPHRLTLVRQCQALSLNGRDYGSR